MILKQSATSSSGFAKTIRENNAAFAVFLLMNISIFGVMAYSAVQGAWSDVFVGLLALLLTLIPTLVKRGFHVSLPVPLEILIYAFVFCTQILGTIACFYVKVPFWDTMLHTISGFMFAAIGFSLVDVLHQNKTYGRLLSPAFMVVLAFCFSMTIGVLWEFFEYFGDTLLQLDMQKDTLVHAVRTVALDQTGSNTPVALDQIVRTTIEMADGSVAVLDGYLDIGIMDTMKDLFVNCLGAIVFCVMGYVALKHSGEKEPTLVRHFIPVLATRETEIDSYEEMKAA